VAGARVHFAVCIYHPLSRLTGEGKDMVPERPPVMIMFGLGMINMALFETGPFSL